MSSLGSLENRAKRLAALVATGDRREQLGRQYDALVDREAAGSQVVLEERLARAAAYDGPDEDAPRIVHILRTWPAERETFLGELDAGGARDRERYVAWRLQEECIL